MIVLMSTADVPILGGPAARWLELRVPEGGEKRLKKASKRPFLRPKKGARWLKPDENDRFEPRKRVEISKVTH